MCLEKELNSTSSPEERLVYSIFSQAVEDYEELKNRKVTSRRGGNCGCYSIKDIEAFFNSKWCTNLLQLINCDLTGRDMLRRVQAKYC